MHGNQNRPRQNEHLHRLPTVTGQAALKAFYSHVPVIKYGIANPQIHTCRRAHKGGSFSAATVNQTVLVNGRNETRNADESWRSAGKRRRQRNSAGYVREKRRKRRKRKKIRAKKRAPVTAAVAQMKV